MRTHPYVACGLLLIAVAALAGCRERGPDSGESRPGATRHIVIQDGNGLLFTFFDRSAQMRTVEHIADVQPEVRKAVMVTSLSGSLPQDRVYVTDLTGKNKDGTYRVWIEQRGTWLDRVIPRASVAQLPEAVAKKRRTSKSRRRKRRRGAAAGAPNQATARNAKEMPKVVMFSTSWCPSCKVARQYFTQKGVPHVDLDVEKNQAAAQKMVEIQKARGMKVGAVPLIIIGNQVYQGFSQMQIEAGLAQLQAPKPAG